MNQRVVCTSLINWLTFDFPSCSLHLGRGKNSWKPRVFFRDYTLHPMKTLALNKVVEHIPSIHDILFLFDLHIDVPLDILDSVRKVSFYL